MSEKPETKKIIHKPANDFRGYYVTGFVVSGPTSDDLYHLTFHIDTIHIKQETGTLLKEGDPRAQGHTGAYELSFEPDDIEVVKEDIARISLHRETALKLLETLQRKFEGSAEE